MEDLNINVVDMHTGGEPLRIIVSGYPTVIGDTILEKRAYVKANLDHLRKFLMFEPRGHFDMFGALPVEPDVAEADAAFLFMHNEGYPTMCGHAVIALGRYCVDQGIVEYKEPETEVKIQCPCGLVKAFVTCKDGCTDTVRFQSVPAFVVETNLMIQLQANHEIKVDISYGGAFYVFVNIDDLDLHYSNIDGLKNACREIKAAVTKQVTISHPDNISLNFIYGVIFTKQCPNEDKILELCIFADQQLDRSPCGSGVTAMMALLHHKGLVSLEKQKTFENPLTHSKFLSKVINTTKCGDKAAVVVEVAGNGYYTGKSTFTSEKKDRLNSGFLLV
uniref:trans-L-3-hydroxyproline dehydratase n=1 Tax=Phallusia mammillata TaxID=59560 RepID=A0A6F9DFG3_9ASCI|nr:trans-L-3-hydroxyproline dehydratase-like [Phallusia mammillata]